MNIASINIKRYRSITASETINLSDLTVLIGPNNEGKSNILNALVCAMGLIQSHASEDDFGYGGGGEKVYDWRRDFPISLQKSKRLGTSVFRLTFELSDAEITEFKREIKSALNGTLPIEITVGRGEPVFKVVKRGPGASALEQKSPKIAAFIGKRVRVNYIPAVRTEEDSMDVIRRMVSSALSALERDEEYRQAVVKVAELQRPIVDGLAEKIATTMQSFLPQVQDVKINLNSMARFRAVRPGQIVVNDGTPTPIEQKGDGVKSLAAISLLHELDEDEHVASILAIEEPEAHLHPEAIHRLREVIEQISSSRQVVVTTHCPLLVNRDSVDSNIIVKNSTAKPARKISEIRECLGVRVSDNLYSANFVVLVEGLEDKIAFDALLPALSQKVAVALREGRAAIDYVGGAGNLTYKATILKSSLYGVHVIVDNDEAGRDAIQRAVDGGILGNSEYTMINCQGMANSELEDCFSRNAYLSAVRREFGVDLERREFRGNSKWSDRVRKCFEVQGKMWNDREEAKVKAVVAEVIAQVPGDAICPHKGGIILEITQKIEERLSQIR